MRIISSDPIKGVVIVKFVRNANSAAMISPAAAAAVGAGRLLVGPPRSIGVNVGYNFDF